eukprot:TRINITY_DN26448_c0_g1_i1.p1 TRINITY_DN26448_c0_g1~~TRINITY_DN26448_c0_g1_i1.p1  ORF type:complete len:1952 (+),score=493.74 TRINITY_DN26448_c0_g1_i1:218-5857(+)
MAASAELGGAGLPRRAAVAVLSGNRKEWAETDFACALNDFMLVGVHPHWSAEKVGAVLADSSAVCVVTEPEHLQLLVEAKYSVRTVVLLPSQHHTEAPAAALASLAAAGVAVLPHGTLLQLGAETGRTHTGLGFGADFAIAGDDGDDASAPFTLMYSSGTGGGPPKATACPKSVWLRTNCNPGVLGMLQQRRTASYMALAHGADRGVLWMTTVSGGSCGFVAGEEGSADFFADMRRLRPTFFLGMAQFWQDRYVTHTRRLYEGAPEANLDGVDTLIAERLRRGAATLEGSPEWGQLRQAFLETRQGACLELEHFRLAGAELGGALLIVVTGGAPTPASVKAFMGGCLTGADDAVGSSADSITVIDSYGTTEFPGVSRNGIIQTDVELRLDPVMRTGADGQTHLMYDPTADPPRGEIVVRRKEDVGQSYWNRPELQMTDADGWYHTGDVGELDYCEGSKRPPLLHVIDRAKNVEELYWQGDSVWVDPGRFESLYGATRGVKHCVLYGDRMREGLVAIVSAEEGYADTWDLANGRRSGETVRAQAAEKRGSAAAHNSVPSALRAEVLATLRAAAKRAGAKEYEVPVACVLETAAWSQHGDGLLTLTGKPKRAAVKQAYEEAVGAANAEGQLSESAPVGYAASPEDLQRAAGLLRVLQAESMVHCIPQRMLGLVEESSTDVDGIGRRRALRSRLRAGDLREVDLRRRGDATTAGGADWLVGEQALSFGCVRDRTADGRAVQAKAAATPPPGDGDTSIIVSSVGGGDSVTLQVFAFESVGALRRRIAAHAGVAKRHVVLVWRGKAVPAPPGVDGPTDEWTVERMGVKEGDKVRYSVRVDQSDEGFYEMSGAEAARLNAGLSAIRGMAMVIREQQPLWERERRLGLQAADSEVARTAQQSLEDVGSRTAAAAAAWGTAMAMVSRPAFSLVVPHIPESGHSCPPFLAAIRAALSSVIRGRMAVLRSQERRGQVSAPADAAATWEELDRHLVRLRELGDTLGVDTRRLPVTWRLDVRWITGPSEDDGAADEQQGTSLGADLSCICDLSGVVLDPEDSDLHPRDLWGDLPARRVRRYRSLDSGVNRHPALHEALTFLHEAAAAAVAAKVPGSEGAVRLLRAVDNHRDEWFVDEKQNTYWLHRWVRTQADITMELGEQTGWRDDTLASMLVRACSAFASRPAVAVPSEALVPAAAMPRITPREALPAAAGIRCTERDSFLWLHYRQLGHIVRRVAEGLRSLGLPDGAAVCICGYNDFEWLVADMAVAVAGYVSVGIHTTYTDPEVPELLVRVGASCLCVMADLVKSGGVKRGWNPMRAAADPRVKETLRAVCVMDAAPAEWMAPPAGVALESFVAWVDPAAGPRPKTVVVRPGVLAECRVVETGAGDDPARPPQAASDVRVWKVPAESPLPEGSRVLAVGGRAVRCAADVAAAEGDVEVAFLELPDPFEAKGRRDYSALPGDPPSDLATVLFTSGSTGAPKAVAFSTSTMVQDCVGSKAEWNAISAGLTVSYIPLSHSSDRMKVWQHLVLGGRVGFCHFSALHWEDHERGGKKDAMIEYSSPVDGLFQQVRRLRPTSMACPPNIWGGLYEKFQAMSTKMPERDALLHVAAMFGGRAKALATGGAPTPPAHMEFAQRLCRCVGASLVDSYGATECGAITADGRQEGAWGARGKFDDIDVALVDVPEMGFESAKGRGEVVVRSDSMALGYFGLPGTDWEKRAQQQTRAVFVDGGDSCPEHITPRLRPGRWYMTGDIAERRPGGTLVLLDRKGAVAACSDGTVVHPAQLETALQADDQVQNAVVFADGRHAAVAAVVVVPGGGDTAAVERRLRESPAVAAHVPGHIDRLRLHFEPRPWSVANGMLSGELKKRRAALRSRYADVVSQLLAGS